MDKNKILCKGNEIGGADRKNEIYGIQITANIKDFQDKMNAVKKTAENIKSVEDRIKNNEIKITGVGFDTDAFKKAEEEYEKWRQEQNKKSYFNEAKKSKISNTETAPDVKTNLFKQKMNELKKFGQDTVNKIRQAWTSADIDINTNDAIVRIEQLKEEIRTLRAEMRSTTPGSQAFKNYATAINEAETELKDLVKSQKEASKSTDSLNKKAGTTGGTVSKSFSRARNSILRFALSLFSVGSIFATVSKASSSYLSVDTDLANKLSAAWAGLGAFLAPIIEVIANKILKLVKYMNVFLKAVTGQDLLAKAAKKATASINAQSKATKKLNKQLSDMDEITNINQDETTGVDSTPVTNPFDAFEDVEIDQGIADKLTKLGEKIREFYENILKPFFDFVKKNWEWLLPLVVAAGVAISLLIARVSKTKALKKAGTDFTGFFNKLGSGLKNLATLTGVAFVLKELGNVIKEISNLFEKFSESGLSLGEAAGLLAITLGELAVAFGLIAAATKLLDIKGTIGAIAVLGGLALVLNSTTSLLNSLSQTGMSVSDVFGVLASVLGTVVVAMGAISAISLLLGSNPMALIAVAALTAAISAVLLVVAETLPTILDAISKFITEVGPTLIDIINAVSDGLSKIIEALGTSLPPILDSVGNLFEKIFNTIGKAFKTAINFIIKGLNLLIRGLNKVKIEIPDWVPVMGGKEFGFKLKEIPLLNVGTNYVPEDQMAYIHKGEAVIPKKFNSAEYFSSINNNDETNALLIEVNRNLLELIDKDTNLYVDGKNMSKALYKPLKNEEQRLGSSSTVVVR